MGNDIKKTHHQLPDNVAEAFAHLAQKGDAGTRNVYIAALRQRNWTLQSLSDVSGVTRERVRQIAKTTSLEGEYLNLPLPVPPEKPVKGTQKREYVEPSPEALERLLELQPAAQSVRGNSPKYRAEAEEYTKLLWDTHKPIAEGGEGVTLYRLALRLGVKHGALRFRLARYGYKTPKTGASKVYAPIKSANRPIS